MNPTAPITPRDLILAKRAAFIEGWRFGGKPYENINDEAAKLYPLPTRPRVRTGTDTYGEKVEFRCIDGKLDYRRKDERSWHNLEAMGVNFFTASIFSAILDVLEHLTEEDGDA